MAHRYLQKANDDLISHCRCDKADALISAPGQMDCPWCGCGWLFICRRCRSPFTFAECIEVDESWQETGDRVVRATFDREPEPGEVEEAIGFLEILLKGIEIGETYVYFDGYVIPAAAEGLTIEGWHSRHDLDFVPQVASLTDSDVYDQVLCSRDYWQANRLKRNDR